MTAATRTAASSKAAKFADDAEALGWTVTREKINEGGRRVLAERGQEGYEMVWHRNSAGALVFAYGTHTGPHGVDTDLAGPIPVLRNMTLHRTESGALLPFDLANADDSEILTALAGKTICWRTTFGTIEDGECPRGGLHYRLSGEGAERTLHFPSQLHTGFRSVRLSAITKVR